MLTAQLGVDLQHQVAAVLLALAWVRWETVICSRHLVNEHRDLHAVLHMHGESTPLEWLHELSKGTDATTRQEQTRATNGHKQLEL